MMRRIGVNPKATATVSSKSHSGLDDRHGRASRTTKEKKLTGCSLVPAIRVGSGSRGGNEGTDRAHRIHPHHGMFPLNEAPDERPLLGSWSRAA